MYREIEKFGTRQAIGKEKELKIGDIRPFSFEGKYRDWTENETKPFGAHKYVTLNGDRKGIELKGVFIGSSVFYARKISEDTVEVFALIEKY